MVFCFINCVRVEVMQIGDVIVLPVQSLLLYSLSQRKS